MSRRWLYYYVGLSLLVSACAASRTTVRIKQGILTGTQRIARHGKKFNAYYGIPYARPPVGNLRFQSPEPAHSWSRILYANTSSPTCLQADRKSQSIIGQEDCLYLNIFTPETAKPGDNIPVMVFVYGGAFTEGSNERESPEYIMNFDVVVVQINYRLGPFGFLSTGDTVISGNQGLKDQTMALKWTRNNVYEFGGDPNRVTLAGHSSGGICVHLHTLSPLSKGLFHRAIILSGSGFGTTSFFHPDIAEHYSNLLAQELVCENRNSSHAILKCLLETNAEKLLLASMRLMLSRVEVSPVSRPVIESRYSKDAFISEFPPTMKYQSTSIPWLIGRTSSEGATMAAMTMKYPKKALDLLNYSSAISWPLYLGYFWSAKPKHQDYITNVFKSHYMNNRVINTKPSQEVVRMMSDVYFDAPIYHAIISYPGPRYVYLYDYRSSFSSQMTTSRLNYFLGISHVDDLQLLMKREESAGKLSPRDIVVGDEILKRWVNFMYTGNTNEPLRIDTSIFSPWSPIVSNRIEYMRIKLNGSMHTDYDRTGYQFTQRLPLFSNFYSAYHSEVTKDSQDPRRKQNAHLMRRVAKIRRTKGF